MVNRIVYALIMAFKHRKALSVYKGDKTFQSRSILNLDLALLKTKGIKIIALDFDGVLAPHGTTEISLEISNWLHQCTQIFGRERVFIVTNKPSTERADYFAKNFSGIEFVFPKQKKPYPDSILFILQKTHINATELLVVDDRLLTGILAAIIADAQGCYITQPLIDLRKRPIRELFIMGLRKFERWAL